MNKKNILFLICTATLLIFFSCSDDFLDKEPKSDITPENFLVEESQLAAYAIARYDAFPTHSNSTGTIFARDNHTDNMASRGFNNKYVPGELKVAQSGGDWEFTKIYQCNYFLQTVLPRFKEGGISGNIDNIKHYIGEVYMIRAFNYFEKLKTFGDFPIVKTVLPDQKDVLIAASKRAPQSEVARFIIADLDSAIVMMKQVAPDGNKNRLSIPCAQLLKSRVALYEATWLKYFKGTAYVPNGPGWPGGNKDYNSGYQYQSGSIDNEIEYFLDIAMTSAGIVAEQTPLVPNNMVIQQSTSDPVNEYFNMFGDVDLAKYSEVLLWRQYDRGLGIVNNVAVDMGKSNAGVGFTRGMMEGFLMANGLPIYAPGSGYAGDDYINLVRKDRDGRLVLFTKEPGQINILYPSDQGTHATPVEPYPDFLNLIGNSDYPTGYANRKGLSYDAALCGNMLGYTGSIVFRGVEAYLNYLEACYEKNGSLDAKAKEYWVAIRSRAGVDTDYQKTIDATDLTKEAMNDWGVYSAGQMVDKTLYNIRRERRCELMAEGLRDMDLCRWRAKDQMITTPYHIEGFKIWGPMQHWYDASQLTYGIGDASTVSDPALSEYARLYEKTTTSLAYNGYKWAMAHYWSPIAVQHFLITSENNDVSTSLIYQNPDWPIKANGVPLN